MEKKLEPKNEPRKLSYEELENVAHQLSAQAQQLNAQNQKLKAALAESNLVNFYKRLDYLFNIIDKDNPYLPASFKEQCAKEIQTLMTPPEKEETLKEE